MSNPFKSVPVKSYEITPKETYFSRRDFIKAAGVIAGSAALVACAPSSPEESEAQVPVNPAYVDELGNPANTFEEITSYNNYYEFSTNKEAVKPLSENFTTRPWTVEVYGLVNKPRTFGIEDLLKLFTQEERIYRLRCVEAWSMVIPWQGFTLASLLNLVEPTSDAQYVRFETVYRPEEMKGQGSAFYPWPYNEGLRMDEAMNDLTILATGLYGEPMPNQNGAPIRLVVPWKYGFKSIKSIVKIELTNERPNTLWSTVAPNEYGFYANVNPQVNHPRWSQASERRIGELTRRETLMFNGYGEQVAEMYADMNLQLHY
jgi:methionine sulfoxide reductase catalytic subunit